MGWFSKEEKVPEIPPAPKFPEVPKASEKPTHELPSFPSNLGENLNREIVKSAVSDVDSSEEKEAKVEELPRHFHIKEEKGAMLPSIPSKPQEPAPKVKEKIPEFSRPFSEKETKPTEPIFVRIDKFQSAQKEFEEIKSKIKEIESTLKKIKETKLKEDTEISEWIQNLENIKSRLSEIDSKIFKKI